ncbi:O-antigen translocase [Candidatus Kaistella beijingensis]|uniref:O-antigen translocase n=1 Tax=Candidatus Kaistella beijingensis TaxID=2820270 RepID=UPI001CC3B6AE|nr:O-antigen translocase [Candidatus Kaistella beijingensis]UBB88546.1 O-antigen translocase [Candidatus Kaistella beijingensis]
MKATSIFGGVQVFNIIIALIRSKVVAVLLGPAGMGIMGLLLSTTGIIASATNFGLSTSAVREISQDHESGNNEKIVETVSVFRKLVWLTGLLGTVVTVLLSPFLSKLTFGNYDYTFSFILISVTLLVGQLTIGQTVLLQGMRKISWMAKAGIYSSLFGLIISLPLYYYFGMDGIVPAIILSAIAVFIIQYFFAKKIDIKSKFIPFKLAFQQGKGMLKLGFMISLSGFITVAASYIIRIFISRFGGVDEVGFYNAGFAIVNTYVGMVFSAMGTDYYPRLAQLNKDTEKSNLLISQQGEIALIILSPLICIFLIFINWIVVLLYSQKFLPVTEMIHWAMLGIFFKACTWSIGFLLLAKGDSKAFFWNELVGNIYLLLLNCIGYYWMGMEGLGISFLIGYFLYFLQIFLFCRSKYDFRFNNNFYRLFLLYLTFCIIGFLSAYFLNGLSLYVVGSIIILMLTALSFHLLNRKMDIFNLLKNKLGK